MCTSVWQTNICARDLSPNARVRVELEILAAHIPQRKSITPINTHIAIDLLSICAPIEIIVVNSETPLPYQSSHRRVISKMSVLESIWGYVQTQNIERASVGFYYYVKLRALC